MPCRNRWPLRLKLFYWGRRFRSKGRHHKQGYERLPGNDDDEEQEYDLTVSYGPDDLGCSWVKKTLIPRIDRREAAPLKELTVFFEDGDVTPNECPIGSIAEAMYHSRKVLLVLTSGYLADSRRCYEIELALNSRAEKEGGVVGGIVLVLMDAEDVRLPKTLHPLLEQHRQLHWTPEDADGQRLFWEQLEEKLDDAVDQFIM